MPRHRWAGGIALSAMALSALSLTGFTSADHRDSTADSTASGATSEILTTGHEDEAADSADSSDGVGSESVRVRHARVNPYAVRALCSSHSGTEVTFRLFDDLTVQAVEESRSSTAGTVLWTGTVAGTADTLVQVTLVGGCDATPGNEELTAEFMLGGDIYAIEPTGPGRVTVSQVSPLSDEDEPKLGAPPAAPPRTAAGRSAVTPRAIKAGCKGGKGTYLIDLLVGYTPKALKEAGGTTKMKSGITSAVALANDAFASSGVKARLRLVHTTPVTGVSAKRDGVTQDLIKAVATKGDKVAEEAHTLRDKYGADLVSVIAGGKAAGGLGYSPQAPSPKTSNYGYSVVAQSALTHYSFGHEIGHNLGASHDRKTQPKQPPPYGANGYFPKNGAWSSLMAYESGCRKATSGRCGRINRFANAGQTYKGQPLGVKLGKANEADTGVVFDKTSYAIASYRVSQRTEELCAVTTSVTPKSKGTVKPAQVGPYPNGTTVSFTAKPGKGYKFSSWTLDGKKQSGGSPKISVSVTKDLKLAAAFVKGKAKAGKVKAKSSGGGKVKKASSKRAAMAGADALYEAVPEPGWHFVGWTLDGSSAGDDSAVELDLGEEDLNLTAVFDRADHDLDLQITGGRGSVALSNPSPFADGDTVIATATPAKGFIFTGWKLDGEEYDGDNEPGKGETAVSFDGNDRTLTAVFAPKN